MSGDDDDSPRRRLSQVASHLAPKPNDWSDITSQISTLQSIARTPLTSSPSYIRQKTRGKLWVRERIAALLDAGSFREIGSITGSVTWDADGQEVRAFVPSNNVVGTGMVDARRVLVTADDFVVRAGHSDGAMMEKTIYGENLALEMHCPVVKLVDGSSGGGSVTTIKTEGYMPLPSLFALFSPVVKQLDAGIPNVAAILGPSVGLGAARASICHFSVCAADVGYLFAAGPKIVEGATFEEGLKFSELGGAQLHCSNGTIDNLAASEAVCFQQIRHFLSYLPSSGSRHLPPFLPPTDPPTRKSPALNSLIPRRAARSFNMRTLITTFLDTDSFFEIGALWGRTAIVGLARLGGFPVGVIASDGMINAGALDAGGCQKISKHLRLCDVFNLPVVQLVDCPGFAVGTAAERAGTMRWGVDMAHSYYSTTVPIFTVLVRRCYGVAGGIMADARKVRKRVAWPSAEWGSLPLDGGIEVAHRKELEEAGERRAEVLEALKKEYDALLNPVRSTNRFAVEEIVRPEDTRTLAAEWVALVYKESLWQRLEDRKAGRVRPSFR